MNKVLRITYNDYGIATISIQRIHNGKLTLRSYERKSNSASYRRISVVGLEKQEIHKGLYQRTIRAIYQ